MALCLEQFAQAKDGTYDFPKEVSFTLSLAAKNIALGFTHELFTPIRKPGRSYSPPEEIECKLAAVRYILLCRKKKIPNKSYNNKNWHIEDHGNYITVDSTNTSGTGVPVHIYPNKPGHLYDGIADIKKAEPNFSVFVARGHCYHTDEEFPLIPDSVKLVDLGGCMGAQSAQQVLQKNPDAQIMATQGTRSMYVNDPMLLAINESIRTKGMVDWKEQQHRLDSVASENGKDYLLPNKNWVAKMQAQYTALGKADMDATAKANAITPVAMAAPAAPTYSTPQPTAPAAAVGH